MTEDQQIEPGSFKYRVIAYQVLIVLLFPISLVACGYVWLMDGSTPRELYWRVRPVPKIGLRKLREEEKWAYIRAMETEIAELKDRLTTPEAVLRAGLSEAAAEFDFERVLNPILSNVVDAFKGALLRVVSEAVADLPRRAPVPKPQEVEIEAAVVEEPIAEAPIEERPIPEAAVGAYVAAAALKFQAVEPLDPELEATLKRLRGE